MPTTREDVTTTGHEPAQSTTGAVDDLTEKDQGPDSSEDEMTAAISHDRMSGGTSDIAVCARGLHPMAGDNVVVRTGDRAGRRECRACRREAQAQTYRNNRDSINRLRCARDQARAQGLFLRLRGGVVTLHGRDGVVFTSDIASVERWLEERAVRRPSGPVPAKPPAAWAPWLELFAEEQRAAKLSPGTIQTRTKHLVVYALRNPGSDPLTVTRTDLKRYLGESEWRPTTVHAVKSTFAVFFRTLCDLGHRVDDPARSLPRVRVPRRVPRPCPEDVVRAVCNTDDTRVRLAVRVAAETGLRRCEVATLHTCNVHGTAGQHELVIRGKGGHERAIPISDTLADELLALPTGFVFPNRRGGPLSPSRLGQILHAALPPGWTPHTLRHRFGTVVYQTSGDLRAVQELLGHASPVTTAIYTKVSDDSKRRAAMAALL